MDEQNITTPVASQNNLQQDINNQLETKAVLPETHSQKNLIIVGIILLVIVVAVAVYLLLPKQSDAPVQNQGLTASQKLDVLSQMKTNDAVSLSQKKTDLQSLESNTSVSIQDKGNVLQGLKSN
jgi:uncharacterized protein YpmB